MLEKLKTSLEEERARLEGELGGVATRDKKDPANWNTSFPQMGEGHNASSTMMEEGADEVEEYDARLETEDALESRLRDVTRALEKIGSGSYGMCEACGNEIPEDRLRANPAARFDMGHEQK